MKRLKTFKQLRRGDSIPNDPNAIQLDELGGKYNIDMDFVLFNSRIHNIGKL